MSGAPDASDVSTPSRPRRHVADGAVRVFLADAILVPTALVTVVYLTRRFGPEGYGLYALTYALVGSLGATTISMLARATIKLVGDAKDWRPIGATVLRVHLFCGLAEAVALWLASEPLAALFDEPLLASYLRIFAWELVLFCAACAHRHIAIGLGLFRLRARAAAIYWIVKLLLTVGFVEMGFSIPGVLVAAMSASVLEIAIYRLYIRPSLFQRSRVAAKELWSYAQPLMFAALCLGFFSHVGLFALKVLGGTAADAGFYGAARNLAMGPRLVAISFAPLLLSTVTRLQSSGRESEAREIVRDALRFVLGLLPLAGIAAGTAPELVGLLLGAEFAPTAPLLTLLLVGELALFIVSVAGVILIAAGQPRLTLTVSSAMLLVATVGHALAVPRFGAVGAASVTAAIATLGAAASTILALHLWHVALPVGTLTRGALLTLPCYMAAVFWPTPDLWLIPKLLALVALVPVGFGLLGEFSARERGLLGAALRSVVLRSRSV
jgi:O-antigen/teichoic acid export membrane protein